MKLLLDTNVLLDAALERDQQGVDAAAVLAMLNRERIEGFIAAHAVTTIYYLLAQSIGDSAARLAISDLMTIVSVVPIGASELRTAMALPMRDFEDAVQVAAALVVDADYVVTGNLRDFRESPVPSRSAAAIRPLMEAESAS